MAHALEVRPGKNESCSRLSLTVIKSNGTQVLETKNIEDPVLMAAIQNAWTGEFVPIPDTKKESEELFEETRELVVPKYGKYVWKLRHHFPKDPARTYPEDTLEFVPAQAA